MGIFKKKEKKESFVIPFRTDKNIKEFIDQISEAEGISASSVVNSIISNFYSNGDYELSKVTNSDRKGETSKKKGS